MRSRRLCLILVLFVGSCSAQKWPFQNYTLPIEERVNDLVFKLKMVADHIVIALPAQINLKFKLELLERLYLGLFYKSQHGSKRGCNLWSAPVDVMRFDTSICNISLISAHNAGILSSESNCGATESHVSSLNSTCCCRRVGVSPASNT